MQEYLKKAGILLSHAICIFIVIYCFAHEQEPVLTKEKEVQAVVLPDNKVLPTAAPIVTATLTPEPTKTPVPTPTLTPVPTMTPSPTPTLTVAPTMTPSPTPTPTPVPTMTPSPTPTPTVTPTMTPSPTPTLAPTAIPTVTPTVTVMPTVTSTPAEETGEAPTTERTVIKNQVLQNMEAGIYSSIENIKDNWWFRRKQNHVPSGSGEQFDIKEYQGFFRNKDAEDEDKVIYLTIDCGYGSSNTDTMLDIFKKHGIKVTFFVTNFFMDKSPEQVVRMVEEGHVVGNHSVTHADLTSLSDKEIYEEIIECEEKFFEVTGTQMDLYFRPPEGSYSKRTLQITEDLGYKTIFWSIAYNDYDLNNQPGKAYVIDHFTTYHHNGAIPLMHNDSDSNMEAMDDVITLLKEQGYRFGTLEELK